MQCRIRYKFREDFIQLVVFASEKWTGCFVDKPTKRHMRRIDLMTGTFLSPREEKNKGHHFILLGPVTSETCVAHRNRFRRRPAAACSPGHDCAALACLMLLSFRQSVTEAAQP
jgi:hypothetical protein